MLQVAREKLGREEWKDYVAALRAKGRDWKYIVADTLKLFYWVTDKDIVDFVLSTYYKGAIFKKAVYKPERKLVFVRPVEEFFTGAPGVYQYYLVKGEGLKGYGDLSFDAAEIARLERGKPRTEVCLEELKKIVNAYRVARFNKPAVAMHSMERISEIIGRIDAAH